MKKSFGSNVKLLRLPQDVQSENRNSSNFRNLYLSIKNQYTFEDIYLGICIRLGQNASKHVIYPCSLLFWPKVCYYIVDTGCSTCMFFMKTKRNNLMFFRKNSYSSGIRYIRNFNFRFSSQRQITLRILGYHFSSRLTATLYLCLIYLKSCACGLNVGLVLI